MKKYLVVFGIAVIVFVGASRLCALWEGNKTNWMFPLMWRTAVTPLQQQTIDLRDLRFEIADTSEKRERGLSGHAPLADDEGMLFIFEEPGIYPFWMKDMAFAIDIIWLEKNIVVDIVTLPATTSSLAIPASHVPTHSADMVIEVRAGIAREKGLWNGKTVLLP